MRIYFTQVLSKIDGQKVFTEFGWFDPEKNVILVNSKTTRGRIEIFIHEFNHKIIYSVFGRTPTLDKFFEKIHGYLCLKTQVL